MKSGIGLQGTFASLGQALQVGFSVVASLIIGLFLGMWLDARLGTSPWATFGLSLAGVLVGSFSTYRVAASMIRGIVGEGDQPASPAGVNIGKQFWQATRLGLVLSAPVLIAFAAGLLIDGWLGSSPWATLLLPALGLVAGSVGAYRLGSQMIRQIQVGHPVSETETGEGS